MTGDQFHQRSLPGRLVTTAALVVGVLTIEAILPSVASAHGVGGIRDLPVPTWLAAWLMAGLAVALRIFLAWRWREPRLAQTAVGHPLGSTRTRTAVRAVGQTTTMALLGLAVFAAWQGNPLSVLNIAPWLLYLAFFAAVLTFSPLLDLWRLVSPSALIGAIRHFLPESDDVRNRAERVGHWPAVVVVFSFFWVELAAPDSTLPSTVGWWLAFFLAATVVGALAFGSEWAANTSAFPALFGLFGAMAPITHDEHTLRRRPVLSGLATLEVRPGTTALVMLAGGAIAFDGISSSWWWVNLRGFRTGAEAVAYETIGLIWVVMITWVAWTAGMRILARQVGDDADDLSELLLPALIPLVAGLFISHTLPLLIIDGQQLIALASDPLGRGWDLFGTFGYVINDQVLPNTVLASAQVLAAIGGLLAGGVVAHDRAVDEFGTDTGVQVAPTILTTLVVLAVAGMVATQGLAQVGHQ